MICIAINVPSAQHRSLPWNRRVEGEHVLDLDLPAVLRRGGNRTDRHIRLARDREVIVVGRLSWRAVGEPDFERCRHATSRRMEIEAQPRGTEIGTGEIEAVVQENRGTHRLNRDPLPKAFRASSEQMEERTPIERRTADYGAEVRRERQPAGDEHLGHPGILDGLLFLIARNGIMIDPLHGNTVEEAIIGAGWLALGILALRELYGRKGQDGYGIKGEHDGHRHMLPVSVRIVPAFDALRLQMEIVLGSEVEPGKVMRFRVVVQSPLIRDVMVDGG